MSDRPQPSAPSFFRDPTRLISLGVLLAVAVWLMWRGGGFWAFSSDKLLLTFPVLLGALLVVLRAAPVSAWINDLGETFRGWRARMAASSNKVVRFLLRPFVAVTGFVWDSSEPIADPDLRAGTRLMVQAYFFALYAFIASVAVGVVVVVVCMGLVFAIIAHFAGGGSTMPHLGSGKPVDPPPAGPLPPRNQDPSRVHSSKPAKGWLGERVDHYDEAGIKIGESQPSSDLLGAKTDHFDEAGRKVAESRPSSDLFGPKTDHFDTSGAPAGESRPSSDLFGEKTDHFDETGRKVGESRPSSDLFGPKTDHFEEPVAEKHEPSNT